MLCPTRRPGTHPQNPRLKPLHHRVEGLQPRHTHGFRCRLGTTQSLMTVRTGRRYPCPHGQNWPCHQNPSGLLPIRRTEASDGGRFPHRCRREEGRQPVGCRPSWCPPPTVVASRPSIRDVLRQRTPDSRQVAGRTVRDLRRSLLWRTREAPTLCEPNSATVSSCSAGTVRTHLPPR